MIERLESLGLTSYESRALEHLLKVGSRTAPDLARETGIPLGRVYDTLKALVERGVVSPQSGRPRSYATVPVASVAARLLASSKRRLQAEERRMEETAHQLEDALQGLANKAAPGGTSYGVRLGEEASRDFLIEATHAARGRVTAYLAFEDIQDEDLAIFDAFRGAVVRGVRTRLLLRERDLEYLMGTPYVAAVLEAMLPHLGEVLQVRITRDDSVPFSVLDAERAVIGVRNPTQPERYVAVVHVDDSQFAKQLEDRFEQLWQEAGLDRGVMQGVLRRLSEHGDSRTSKFLEAMVRRRASKGVGKGEKGN